MSLFNYFSNCLPSLLTSSKKAVELNTSNIDSVPLDQYIEYYNSNFDYSKEYDSKEHYSDIDGVIPFKESYPTIRVYGHGWDPTDSDNELTYPSYKKVNSLNMDLAYISALSTRSPYIECEDDDVSKNVELLDWCRIPNMLISICDFKNALPHNFKFGIYDYDNDTGNELYINNWWLETMGQCSVFTLKELVCNLNEYYQDGYNLELHMGRMSLLEFKGTDMPDYVQFSDMANELMYEYSKDNINFVYLPRIPYIDNNSIDDNYSIITQLDDLMLDSKKLDWDYYDYQNDMAYLEKHFINSDINYTSDISDISSDTSDEETY